MKSQEKKYETALRVAVQRMGGECLKFQSPYSTGWLDRAVLMPGGRYYPLEVKDDGKIPSRLQRSRIRKLIRMGFTPLIVNSKQSLTQTIDFLSNAIQK